MHTYTQNRLQSKNVVLAKELGRCENPAIQPTKSSWVGGGDVGLQLEILTSPFDARPPTD